MLDPFLCLFESIKTGRKRCGIGLPRISSIAPPGEPPRRPKDESDDQRKIHARPPSNNCLAINASCTLTTDMGKWRCAEIRELHGYTPTKSPKWNKTQNVAIASSTHIRFGFTIGKGKPSSGPKPFRNRFFDNLPWLPAFSFSNLYQHCRPAINLDLESMGLFLSVISNELTPNFPSTIAITFDRYGQNLRDFFQHVSRSV